MSTIKTALGDIQSSEQVEQLLMDYDFDELVESLTVRELIDIYILYHGEEGVRRVAKMLVKGPWSDESLKEGIIEALMEVIF